MLRLQAEWTDDCQGKKDYDGPIIEISTRYWPDLTAMPMLILVHGEDDYIELARPPDYITGATREEVQCKAEAWAQAEMDRLVAILAEHYPALKEPTDER